MLEGACLFVANVHAEGSIADEYPFVSLSAKNVRIHRHCLSGNILCDCNIRTGGTIAIKQLTED
jgi:hypothetical protein